MADPNQYNVGEPVVWGVLFQRPTVSITATPSSFVALNVTSGTLAVTDPSGAVTTTNFASWRNLTTGRYEFDQIATSAGRWNAKWTGNATYTDELGATRTYVGIETDFVDVVSP